MQIQRVAPPRPDPHYEVTFTASEIRIVYDALVNFQDVAMPCQVAEVKALVQALHDGVSWGKDGV